MVRGCTTQTSRVLRTGEGPESPPCAGRKGGAASLRLTIAQAAQKQQAMKAAPTRAADIRRRQRAVWIRPHILRGPAGQSPMRLSHHASQEVLKPGLCFSANQCPGTWRRRRVRACTDPHTGSASCQICMDPLPMRRSQWPSHIGPHARLVLACVCARFFCAHNVCTQGGAAAFQRHAQARGFCLQGFPFECFDQLGPSLAGSAKQLQAEEAPHKTLIMRILALKLQF